jgi:hypothetical protein
LEKELYISSYCKINNNKITLNGKIIFIEDNTDLKSFLKNAYKNLEIKYPKFFKMDNLCKLAFLSAEIVLNDSKILEEDQNVALVFSNNASSLDTDRKHQEAINDRNNFYPSPAVFVYTLPNITIGEISIKHGLQSESAFFIFENYKADFHQIYENSLIQNKKSKAVLGGWINVDLGNYEAFLYLVSEKGKIEHTEQNLNKLYKN